MAGATGLPRNPKRDDIVDFVRRRANVSKQDADRIVTNATNWSKFLHDQNLLIEYLDSRVAVFRSEQKKAADTKAKQQASATQQYTDAKRVAGLLHAMGLYSGPTDRKTLLGSQNDFTYALAQYQQQRGLKDRGVLTDDTLKDVNKALQFISGQSKQPAATSTPGAPSAPAAAPAGIPTDPASIRTEQQQMKNAGFDPGAIDGIWGPRTQAAYDAWTKAGRPAASGGSVADTSAGAAPTASPTSTGTYSPEDIAYYAKQVGFTGDGLRNIVAIAMAESNGRGHAVGDSGQSHGLFQIYAPAHPQYDTQRLMDDPAYAAAAAYAISKGGTDFSPWTTWTHNTPSGAAHPAQQFLTRATQAVQSVETGYTPGSTTGVFTGTTSGSGTTTDQLPPNASPAQVQAYVESHYPTAAPFFANDEIRAILIDGAKHNLDDTEIEARIRQTQYWQTHGASSRAFDALIADDPHGAGQLVEDTKKTVTSALSQQGITVDDTRAGDIAKAAIRAGWISTSGQIQNQARFNEFTANMLRQQSQFYRVSGDTLVRNMDGSTMKVSDSPWATKNDDGTYLIDAGTPVVDATGKAVAPSAVPGAVAQHVALPAGAASGQADAYMAQAKKYGVPMTRAAAEDWALKALQGTATNESFMGWLTQQAKGRWAGDPNVISAIDSGIDPTTYFDSAKSHIANILEKDPNTIDILNDPKYMQVTQFIDPKTGQRRSMTLGEADQWARSQPEFKNTTAYRQTDADIATKLGSFFGAAA